MKRGLILVICFSGLGLLLAAKPAGATTAECTDPYQPVISGFTSGPESSCSTTPHNRKWRNLLERRPVSRQKLDQCLKDSRACEDYKLFAAWKQMLQSNHGSAPLHAVRTVNRFFNSRLTYVDDRSLYQNSDYWASLAETLKTGKGDCDDYAIAKYATLLRLLPEAYHKNMRVLINYSPATKTGHFVAGLKIDGKTYIMDNLRSDLAPYETFRSQIPAFSANRDQQWCHYNYNLAGYGCSYRTGFIKKYAPASENYAQQISRIGGCARASDNRSAAR